MDNDGKRMDQEEININKFNSTRISNISKWLTWLFLLLAFLFAFDIQENFTAYLICMVAAVLGIIVNMVIDYKQNKKISNRSLLFLLIFFSVSFLFLKVTLF